MTPLLHNLFEEQARNTPDAPALAVSGDCLSYRELDTVASHLAHHMTTLGVREGTYVQIYLSRSVELITAILAVLKCGAAYVPLDPAYPTKRIAFLIKDLDASLLLTNQQLEPQLPDTVTPVLCVDEIKEQLSGGSNALIPRSTSVDSTAVVLYTSGSTGWPKGVLLHHRGLVNYLVWERTKYTRGPGDRVMQQCSISFDFSLWEIFTALANGGCLVLPRPLLHFDGPYLVDLIRREKVTILGTSPSILSLLIDVPGFQKCSSMRTVVAGGESLSYDLQERFFVRSAARLINIYGPTETTISATQWECSRDSPETLVPIGFPAAGARVLLLDEEGNPVSAGSEGELYVGGPGVGTGYHNRPELNAQHFLDDPFTADGGARLYRTGDRARQLPNGAFEYLGRYDNQVKLNGLRIELEEVEFALRKCSGIRDCVAVVTDTGRGNRKLVAYYVLTGTEKRSPSQLRTDLGTTLPDFMIPSLFLEMDRLPLTPNGKIDRKGLPPIVERMGVAVEPPATETERLVTGIWTKVLGIEHPDVTANFFEVGGDSMTSLEVSMRIEEQTGTRFPLSLIYEACTIRDQATRLDAGCTHEEGISCVPMSRGCEDMSLVCVGYPGGGLQCFADLVDNLPTRRIFGLTSSLDPPQTDGSDPIQAIGRLQTDALLKAVPRGQLVIAGFSVGGFIALEVSHRLLKLGRLVKTVVLLDSATPAVLHQIREGGLYGRVTNSLRALRQRNWMGRQEFLYEYFTRLKRRTGITLDRQLRRIRRALAEKPRRDLPSVRATLRRRRSLDDSLYEMVKQYKIPRYEGQVLLIRARDQSMAGLRDSTLGWGDVVPNTVEVRNVPGYHHSMLRREHVRHVATILRELLGSES